MSWLAMLGLAGAAVCASACGGGSESGEAHDGARSPVDRAARRGDSREDGGFVSRPDEHDGDGAGDEAEPGATGDDLGRRDGDSEGRASEGGSNVGVPTEHAADGGTGDASTEPRDAAVDGAVHDAGETDAGSDAGMHAPDASAADAGPDAGDASAADAATDAGDAGTDAGDTGGPLTFLNPNDAAPNIALEPDGLSAEWRTLATAGIRSTRAIAPGEGVFYYEAVLPEPLTGLTLGVASATARLDQNAGGNDQSFGIDPGGQIYAGGTWVGGFPAGGRVFGFALDYRGAQPVVHAIASVRGQPAIVRSETLAAVTGPVFIYLAGIRRTTERHVTVNPGNDLINAPFAFEAAAVLRAAGHGSAADALVMGWGGSHAGIWNEPPVLRASAGSTVAEGTAVTLTASATDAEDGALDAQIVWEVLSTGYGPERVRGTGARFTFTPAVLGMHPVRVTVNDSGGKQARTVVDVQALGVLPQQTDVRIAADPLSGSGVVISDDGLRVHWTAPAKMGVRANQALYGGFWYFEARRLGAPANQAAGLVIGGVSLNPVPFNVTPPSCSLNQGGGVFQNLIFRAPPPPPEVEYYGFAVDYRGRHPIVYFVWDDALAYTLALPDATVPIHPMLYGNPTGAANAWDVEVNFGGTPFHYDPIAVLTAAGIDARALRLCWGQANAACP